jgi:hypothetical protein
MIKVNGIDINAPQYIKINCPCGNVLEIPAIEGWAVAGLQGLRFRCLTAGCDREYGQEWFKLPKKIETTEE